MGQPPDGLTSPRNRYGKSIGGHCSPNHPLCKMRRIPVKRLEQETFLVREPGSGTRGAMERFFAAHHIVINRGMETDTSEAIKQAVQAGMGLGIMSLHTAELELETKRLSILDVQDFPIIRHWHVVHRKTSVFQRSAGIQNFVEGGTGADAGITGAKD